MHQQLCHSDISLFAHKVYVIIANETHKKKNLVSQKRVDPKC